MATFTRLSLFVLLLLGLVSASRFEALYRSPSSKRVSRRSCQAPRSTNISACFPALGFTTPSSVPATTDDWWCDPVNEYAFLGFSYEVTACELPCGLFLSSFGSFLVLYLGQSLSQLQTDFANIRNTFNGRYVRLYGACDNEGFYDNVITAAWDNTLGVHALIWFGFTGSNQWMTRRDTLFATLHSNPKAPFVTRVVQFGSEPLYDQVLTPAQLTTQVNAAKHNLSDLGIPVTVSELAYGYQQDGGAQDVLNAIDSINIHMLPLFAGNATTGNQAWGNVLSDLDFFIQNGNGKKMYFDENGWPSETYPGVEPQSHTAVANVANEQEYFTLLDKHCTYLKTVVSGGIGWFAHIYSDSQEPGYGIYSTSGKLKFPFAPRTSC
ncbi:hypothetical protein EI94DRAFT_688992 [Lactarius quietus]|nr:hypothetical protein EI94DRAFT_688992 [Lactarius quietus]